MAVYGMGGNMTMRYRIVDSKGADYYNDPITYATLGEAEEELAEAQKWAREQAKYEPSWEHAHLCIEEAL